MFAGSFSQDGATSNIGTPAFGLPGESCAATPAVSNNATTGRIVSAFGISTSRETTGRSGQLPQRGSAFTRR